MSYILDALKKADRERSLGEVPDLEAAHWGVRRQSKSRLWIWILTALLIFNALLVAVTLLDRDEDDAFSKTEIAQADVTSIEDKPVVPVPRAPVDTMLPATKRPKVPVRPPVPRPPVKQAPPKVSPLQEPVQAPVAAPVRPTPQVTADEFDLPEWRELAMEFRGRFSLPRIDVHVYAEDPARRFVMVDLKKYREGDTLENGALLEKIHPGSIQLNYQGTRFRVER